MNNKNEYFVYCLVNKQTGMKYIGMTGQELKKRWRNGKGYKESSIFSAIQEYGWSSFEKIILESGLSYEQACVEEDRYIKAFNTLEPNGYNIYTGGNKGRKAPESTKDKIRKYHIGKKLSKETVEKIRRAHLGTKHSEESIKKMSEAKKGTTFTETARKRMSESAKKRIAEGNHDFSVLNRNSEKMRKPVEQYTLDGVFVRRYKSISDAAKATDIVAPLIARCCNHRRKTTGNYQWKYECDPEEIKKVNYNLSGRNVKKRKIIQYSLNGRKISEYESLSAAEKITGISKKSIQSVCCDRQKSSHGFIWKYAGGDELENADTYEEICL